MPLERKKSEPQIIHTSASSVQAKNELQFATPQRRIIYWLPAIFLGLGIVVLAGVLLNKYLNNNEQTSLQTIKTETLPVEEGKIAIKMLKVDVEGAVNQPGVYEIPNDSRIQDVLITAGGLSPKADRRYVSRYINLSQKLTDTMKVYIPFEGEITTQNMSVLGSSSQQIYNQNGVTTMININDASQSQLETLSGIGPITAKKIIAARPYQNITELVSKKVIGKSL